MNEAKSRNLAVGSHNYTRIMRARPLDPRSSRMMNSLNSLYNYIELQLVEANNKLDTEWEDRKQQARQVEHPS